VGQDEQDEGNKKRKSREAALGEKRREAGGKRGAKQEGKEE